MNSTLSEYEQKYTQMELLGRGNYGSAYVVKSNQNGKLFVAKKMNLDGMAETEISAAKEEIEILKKFSDINQYPFIVKYIECFCFDLTLIIVMEYCECGDLATFIKVSKKKGDLLEQKIILAWFVMLVMGIQALHSKNVLHRDLKSANIFLTSNKFVKIGDFGISKVLDSTSAKTFVGTPYYLSPEVCSNKKYDLRSDLWSLGCILYELCTLNYPFQANNILSLAMKITSEEVAPISNKYSKDLNHIVRGLLTKDQNKRITLEEILKMPYMIKFMSEHGNKIQQICETIPLKRIKSEPVRELQATSGKSGTTRSNTNEDTMQTIRSNFQRTGNNQTISDKKTDTLGYSVTGMSPTQLMKLRKEQKVRENEELMKKAALENVSEMNNFARTKKREEFGGSGSNFGHTSHAQTLERKYQLQNKEAAEEKYKKKNGLSDAQPLNLEEINEVCNLTRKFNGLTLTGSYSNVEISPNVEEKVIATNENYQKYTDTVEEEIAPEEEELEEYYDEDFEDYIPDEEDRSKIEKENDVLKTIISVVAGKAEQVSPTKLAVVEKTFEKKPLTLKTSREKKEERTRECMEILVSRERFNILYELVSRCYDKNYKYKQTSELADLRKHGSPSEKAALKLIEQIKHYESLQ